MSVQANCPDTQFKDQDLSLWVKKNKNGLILIVSSGMPYSELSMAPIQKEAKERKLSLLVLSDRTDQLQKKNCNSILNSDILIQKGALRHFPALFLVKDHQLLKKVIPGIQTDQELKSNLDQSFKIK